MSKFENVSSSGDLEVPILGRVVKAGEIFEVPADLDAGFVAQPDLWARVIEAKGSK